MDFSTFHSKRLIIIDDDAFFFDRKHVHIDHNYFQDGHSIFISHLPIHAPQTIMKFSVYDGMALKSLFTKFFNVPVILLSLSPQLETFAQVRCKTLGIQYILSSETHIYDTIAEIKQQYNVSNEQMLFLQKHHTFPIDYSAFSFERLQDVEHSIRHWFASNLESMAMVQDLYNSYSDPMQAEVKSYQKSTGIHALIMDIDGTCTRGYKYFSEHGSEWKEFSVRDQNALLNWQQNKNNSAWIITGETGNIVPAWAQCCQIPSNHVFLDANKTKVQCLIKIQEEMKINMENIAYIGDDINDLGVFRLLLSHGGKAICTNNAVSFIKNLPGIHKLKTDGGCGAIEEAIKYVL